MRRTLYLCLFSTTVALNDSSEFVHSLPWEDYIVIILISVGLILVGGMMSGLTVGLMSLDEMELEVKLASGSDNEQRYARKVLPVICKHHFLLVTLLVANSAAMEALPIFLDDMFATTFAIVLSVTFVLLFGEVIPQALCTGPDQLKIASKLVPIVKIVEVIFFPVSYPISKLLDRFFGHRAGGRRTREELKMIVNMRTFREDSGGLSPKQVDIIQGAIDLKSEIVGEHMIDLENVYRVSDMTMMTRENVKTIMHKGYSRVPVHRDDDPNKLIGILLVKQLLELDCTEPLPLSESGLKLRTPIIISYSTSILEVLTLFQQGGSHMAFITSSGLEDFGIVLGIITLEDAFEMLLKMKIEDEEEVEQVTALANIRSKRTIAKRRMGGAGSHPFIL